MDTSTASTVITGLAPGGYEVLVTQRDGAGNVSPVSRLPLVVEPAPAIALAPPPAAPLVAPSAAPPTALARKALRLPARNPARLRPGRAATVRAVRPLLRWRKGPAGTSFYNVQLFRVRPAPAGTATASAVGLRKIASVFPRTTRVRPRALARGGCYVWRVWPYRAGRYTPSPLGVSHFCVSRVTAPRPA